MRTTKANGRTGWISMLAIAVLMCLACSAEARLTAMPRAERHEERHQIDQLEFEWRQAILQRDVSKMNGLLADDYVGITNAGTLESKDDLLTALRSGSMHFESLELSDRKVRFYGSTALVTSRADVVGKTPDGPISGSFRYTRVWVRDDSGDWHIVSFEVSPISGHGDKHEP
jgi:ketosteroid isomerase-like protein